MRMKAEMEEAEYWRLEGERCFAEAQEDWKMDEAAMLEAELQEEREMLEQLSIGYEVDNNHVQPLPGVILVECDDGDEYWVLPAAPPHS